LGADGGDQLTRLTCHAVLFDLDGVLVDSRAVVERTWRRWTERHGLVIPEIVTKSHGRRSVDTLREFAPQFPAADEVAWLEATELCDSEGLVALPGAHDALHALPDDRRAIVTSGGRALALMRLRHTKLAIPAVLIAAEDVRSGKPSPEGYLLAATRLGIDPSQCVVIEDTPAGIKAGGAASAKVIAVTSTFPPDDLREADTVIPSLANLEITNTATRIAIRCL
jgi:sugar-phosphatase